MWLLRFSVEKCVQQQQQQQQQLIKVELNFKLNFAGAAAATLATKPPSDGQPV